MLIYNIPGMKTAISIVDNIYNTAEKLAQRLEISRSELYSRALQAYIEEHYPEDNEITKRLNQIYDSGESDSRVDPLLLQAQLSTLSKEDW